MKQLTADLMTHLASEVTTLCTCWKATLQNGEVFGFTDHVDDVLLDGQRYVAASGYTPTAMSSNSSLAVDNLEVQGILSSDLIHAADIQAGLWDFASVSMFQINPQQISAGVLHQHHGKLGEISLGRYAFTAELRGLTQLMQQATGDLYTPACRADLGDARCGIPLASYTVNGSVTAVTDQREFADASRTEEAGYFEAGLLRWTRGLNTGLAMEVKTFTGGQIQLCLPMPYAISVTDTYELSPGCKKRFAEDCAGKFQNALNFRGEPHVPGNDQMMKVGGL